MNDFLDRLGGILDVDVATLAQKGLNVLLLLVGAWAVIRVSKTLTKRLGTRLEATQGRPTSDSEQRAKTLLQLMNSVVVVLVVTTTALMVLGLFIDIGPLLAGVGVAGLAVSFGAQSLVKDVISGFFLLFENQFDVGDVVEIGGVAGVVERVTFRIVAIRDVDGAVHYIPNGTITKVSNKTSDWARVVLDVGVAYQENVDRVLDTFQKIAKDFWEDTTWQTKLAEPPAVVGVNDLGESAVVIRLTAKTLPGQQWDCKRELRRRIKNRLDQEGIEIPFPQRTVHIKNPPEARPPS